MSNNSQFTDEQIYQQIAKIIQRYKLLECAECAAAIKNWLKANQINGIHLKIKLVGRGLFIVSKRWDNGQTSITQNGTHYGIEARGKVFDNLSTFGLTREQWVADFDCPSGKFIIEEIEKF
ncbi:hypothetical protein L2E65_15805 [Planktothrix agardhii 1801]|uniref:papain fold toxin domain-containing protein n=1 Tax=Planktothrix agardhii TaxID=1160 RepID=UPI001F3D2C5B|nr:papain fold toxin domain-containing protein [Planktothrix agardhii]MCF3626248.1 hypothetical protein [Planktothrix agardhii 1801]